MKVCIKVFGTLGRQISGYDPEHGLELVVPNGTRAGELLAHLSIPGFRQGIIASEGRLLRSNDLLVDGMRIQILQPVFGG